MSTRRSKKSLALGLFVFASVVVMSSLFPYQASAFTTKTYFGGKIDKVTYCPCLYDPAVIITVKPPGVGLKVSVKYSFWLSKLDENYNIWEPGANVVGGFTKGYTQCLRQSGYYCTTNSSAPKVIDGVIDWWRGVGSSGFGGPSFSFSPF